MLRAYHTFVVVASLPPRLGPLRELAYNVWWAWNLDAVDLFRRLDRDLWEVSGHNPVLMLGKIAQDRLEEAVNDDGFMTHMMQVYQEFSRYMKSDDTWFKRNYGTALPDLKIAYFSAEYGITECMAMYSGGLGVLAGDHLKAASDLGLPLVAVGLLYQEGYLRQHLNADGWQEESYPLNDFHNMPVRLERSPDGEPVTVQVQDPDGPTTAQVWRAQVGRVPLYLLDTNLSVNRPEDCAITGRLYGGDLDMRVRQEIVLGIGGMRALHALGIEPTVCHMNEGHSAFLSLERIRMAMEENKLSFAEARELTVAGNVFTTHTAVSAGIDRFPLHVMDHYFSHYYPQLGLSREDSLELGRPPNARADGDFCMAVLALRLAASANGVSKPHAWVARNMWKDMWPGTLVEEVPITSISNGIHPRSWISGDMASLLLRYLGPRWIERPEDQSVWERVDRIPDEELWHTHERRRERLVAVARERLARRLAERDGTPQEIAEAREILHPDVLTIGFARRFATYKRALLLFSDPDRLSAILNQPERPVQLVFAGKAHPRDTPGKEFIRQIVHLSRREDMRGRVVFLEDLDLSLARYLVQGVDVWLNTPRRSMEASGTSGMKAAANGVIHLSTYYGWWCEGYTPEAGWRIGSGEAYGGQGHDDEVEGQALYGLLEKDVVPLFYDRGANGLPRGWIAKMKHSMRHIAPIFNTHRMVREYCERMYLPAARRYERLHAENCQVARGLAAWLHRMHRHWGEIRIVDVESDARDGTAVKAEIEVRARIVLGSLELDDVSVKVYHGSIGSQGEISQYDVVPMVPQGRDEDGNQVYTATISCGSSGLSGYTVRVLPHHPDLVNPYVPGLALWAS